MKVRYGTRVTLQGIVCLVVFLSVWRYAAERDFVVDMGKGADDWRISGWWCPTVALAAAFVVGVVLTPWAASASDAPKDVD